MHLRCCPGEGDVSQSQVAALTALSQTLCKSSALIFAVTRAPDKKTSSDTSRCIRYKPLAAVCTPETPSPLAPQKGKVAWWGLGSQCHHQLRRHRHPYYFWDIIKILCTELNLFHFICCVEQFTFYFIAGRSGQTLQISADSHGRDNWEGRCALLQSLLGRPKRQVAVLQMTLGICLSLR